MDLNDTVQRHDHTQLFGELYMKEAILTINSEISPATTNIRNESNYQIDGIWYSLGLTVLRGRYSKFKKVFHLTTEFYGLHFNSQHYLDQQKPSLKSHKT